MIKRRGLQPGVRLTLLLLFAILILPNGKALAQFGSASHLITVVVNPISVLQVVGGGVNLNISAANAIAGQDQMTVTNSTTQLLWGTNSSTQKVTILTNLGSPLYALKAEALSPTQGLSVGEITLSTVAMDLLLNIGRSSGSSSIRYTGVALASQGIGTDAHTLTFTIAAQ